jgi:hypothetical protein
MAAATRSRAPLARHLSLLDEVQRLPELRSFDAGRFLSALAEEVAGLPDAAAQLDCLKQARAAVDRFAEKAMGIHLTHILAETPAPPQLRTLLATTVTAYADNLPLLQSRVAPTFQRMDPRRGDEWTAAIVTAAGQVLALREQLRAGVAAQQQQAEHEAQTAPPPEARAQVELPKDDRFSLLEID